MEARAWRVCAGAGAGLLGLLALVAWRADALAGGWLLALRLTALLAVVGLLACVLLAGRTALRPPERREVVVRVPGVGPATTAVRGARGAARLQRLIALAVASAAPALVVLALATAPRDAGATGSAPAAAAPGADPAAPPTTAGPSTAGPTTATPGPTTSAPAAAPAGPPAGAAAAPSGAAPAAVPDDAAAPGTACVQVVRAGDSLWRLAQTQLGPGATDAQVDTRWRAVYARNAAAVGPDPDLVRPGLVLDTCP